jgi:hypothetical protein
MWPWVYFSSHFDKKILKDAASPSTSKWIFIFGSWCAMAFWTFEITFKILALIQIELLKNGSKHFAKHISKVRW